MYFTIEQGLSMSASRIDPILAQLNSEVSHFEKTLWDLIQSKNQKKARSGSLIEINKTNQQLKNNPIAIIGMAALFPEAKNLQEYWDNIMREVDCITEVPPSRWDVDTYYDPDPKAQDKTYCKRGGFIPDIDFNPMEFGLPPNILEFTDVSQLVSLVIAKKAMEDAGYGETRAFNREQAGVILGAAVGRPLSGPLTARMQYPVWEKVLKSSGLSEEDTQQIIQKIKLAYLDWEENSFPGMLTNVIAGRIANRLDFGGTNCAIDAACASSLSAFKMAVSELSERRADLMLTGGIDIDNSIVTYLCFSKTPALSKRQESRPFDVESDGMIVGEGVGMLVLKRLADAERDGDRIYAVIKGIGSSSDGRYKSIYAPSPAGQARALVRAYEEAGFSPNTVGLIEAHGTGTAAGDPAEFAALTQVFGAAQTQQQSIALGSVKSQIGHTKAAAGAASLIKATLALHHKVLPATINITQPHPKLEIGTSPFYLNTKTRPWINPIAAPPRRAGVSSFGFGGTNFHIVLEEYETEQPPQPYRLHSTVQSLLLAAPTPEQLLAHCETVLQRLRGEEGDRHYIALVEDSKTLDLPVAVARLGLVAGCRSDACNLLQIGIEQLAKSLTAEGLTAMGWNHPLGIYYRQTGMATGNKVVALFSGQGSQYLEMGRELALNFPTLRQGYSEMDQLFREDGLKPLSEVVFPPPVFEEAQQQAQVAALQQTDYAQPAIGVFSTSLYKLLQQAGCKPDFVAGHSFGELTALWAAGVLSEADYAVLVKARGQAMAAPNATQDAGAMLAIKGDTSGLAALLERFPQVTIANVNSGQQVVLAGAQAEIAKVQQLLEQQGLSPILLPVAAAFHTPLVAHAQKPFAQAIEAVTFSPPQLPVYTNVTGKRYPAEPQAIQTILKAHLINQVCFQREIETIYADGGYCFIEFGPKGVLTNLVKEILVDRPHEAIALNAVWRKDSDRQLREAVIQLRVIGLPLRDLDAYQREQITPEINAKAKILNVRLTATNYVSEKTKLIFDQALQNGHQVNLAVPAADQSISLQAVSMASMANTNSAINAAANIILDQTQEPSSRPLVTSVATQTTSNSHSSNGHISNGHASNGHISNGHASNGHISNGHASNGHTQNHHGQHPPDSLSPGQNREHQELAQSGQLINATHAVPLLAVLPALPPLPSLGLASLDPLAANPPPLPEPISMQQSSESQGRAMAKLPLNYHRVLESLESSLAAFSHQQRDMLQVHEQYLHQHVDYAQAFLDLTQQQNALLRPGEFADPAPVQAVADSLERSMEQFHQHHGETLRVHDQSLQRQADHARSFFQVLHQQYAGLVNAEITEWADAPTAPAYVSNGAQRLQAKVTELAAAIATPPTFASVGRPGEALVKNGTGATNGNRSADPALGRMVKEVAVKEVAVKEVVAKEVIPPVPLVVPPAAPVLPVEMPTATPEVMLPVMPSTGEVAASLVEPLPETAAPAPAVNNSALVEALLAIVSEKTGYPADMLELDLDMEADLGIDSIKRVEILGTMQQQFPDYPAISPEDLGELRTLGQIIAQMQLSAVGLLAPPPVPNAGVAPALTAPPPLDIGHPPSTNGNGNGNGNGPTGVVAMAPPPAGQTVPDRAPPVPSAPPTLPANAVGHHEATALVDALLAIVSEKTGYPADMLELDLDMEADLGIDSIKRVEILGTMQQQFPDYPAISPEDLGELRTLGQIIAQMQQQVMGAAQTAEKKKTRPPVLATSLT